MSLMLKLSATLLLASSLISANEVNLKKFLETSIKKNPNIISLNVEIVSKQKVKQVEGFDAYIVKLKGKAKFGDKEKPITQSSVYFVKGNYVTTELIDMKSGANLANSIGVEFKNEFYTKENLIYGNANAKHKVAIFSDPLCPFCSKYAPEALQYMKKYPNDFAIYYYHFPLPNLHPAAVAITKAAIVAVKQGIKDVELKMYDIKVNAREKDEQKIIDAFNRAVGSKVTVADIKKDYVLEHFNRDQKIASDLMVRGTPTVFFDGEKDANKMKYKSVKVK